MGWTQRVAAAGAAGGGEYGERCALMQEHSAVKTGTEKLVNDVNSEHAAVIQFWNSGPKEGVVGSMKKHGLPVETVTAERREADAEFKVLQTGLQQYQDQVTAFSKGIAPLKKRIDDVGVKLFMLKNERRDRQEERADLEVAIQKAIGDFNGYVKGDFEGVKGETMDQGCGGIHG